MFRRRGVFSAGVLAALGVALWLPASGFAIRKAIVQELFGPKMVRAQVLEKDGTELNVDRGVITKVNGTQLTLREFDGRIQPITLAGTTQVLRLGRHLPLAVLAPKWHVLVTWPPTGPAQSVDVEKIPRARAVYVMRKALVTELFGPMMVRAQALEKNGSQWNLDRGVITQVNGTQLTLKEADGRIQPITLASTTQVVRLGRHLPLTVLAPKWHVLVTWPATGPAQSVDVEKIPKVRGKTAARAPVPHLS